MSLKGEEPAGWGLKINVRNGERLCLEQIRVFLEPVMHSRWEGLSERRSRVGSHGRCANRSIGNRAWSVKVVTSGKMTGLSRSQPVLIGIGTHRKAEPGAQQHKTTIQSVTRHRYSDAVCK
jgi:hypothetical protein